MRKFSNTGRSSEYGRNDQLILCVQMCVEYYWLDKLQCIEKNPR